MNESRVGFVGLQRGIVGSVYLERSLAENDFERLDIEPVFLSTSEAGQPGPTINGENYTLADAYDLDALRSLDAIVTCQGDDYTQRMHSDLRDSGYDGVWIDAASELRGEDSAALVSDVVNRQQIEKALDDGCRDLVGPNCSSNIMFMGAAGLFTSGLVERVTFTALQAVSGDGTQAVFEQLEQNRSLSKAMGPVLEKAAEGSINVLEVMREANEHLGSPDLETDRFGHAIVANPLAWIGKAAEWGQTTEEKKAEPEINKLLGTAASGRLITIDGTCVRVDSLRSHAMAVHFELNRDVPLLDIEDMVANAHEFVNWVPNYREETLGLVTPVTVSETLDIAIGRVRKLSHGPKYLGAYIVGDQLLWGAAEPLRRTLGIVMERRA